MSLDTDAAYRAGRLMQWGLQPRLRPSSDPEYARLVDSWMNERAFRTLVEEMSEGLGLLVLDCTLDGLILSPAEDSIFATRHSDYRAGSSSVDDRLLDGLVQLAIAATIFPRSEDLEDDLERPRPAVTVDEIEAHLRGICGGLARKSEAGPDPSASEEEERLIEAWRVYNNRFATKETRDGRRSRRSTLAIIEYALTKLRSVGCFLTVDKEGKPHWQPTRRYNVMVQELASTALHEEFIRYSTRLSSVPEQVEELGEFQPQALPGELGDNVEQEEA